MDSDVAAITHDISTGEAAERPTGRRRVVSPNADLVALTSVVLAAFVLSSSYTLTKITLDDLPPLTIGLIRFTVAALLLGIWVRLIRRHPRPTRADIRQLAIGGLLGITIYFSIENVGVDLATASDAALLVAAYPALTALLELIVYRRRTGAQGLVGIGLAIVGVFFVVSYAPASGPNRLIGDVLLVVSGIVWALYNFATRNVVSRYPTPTVLYYQSVAGAIGFLPLALIERDEWRPFTHLGTTAAALTGLILLCSILGLGLYAKGLQRLSPSAAVNVLNLVPLFGLVIAVVTLREAVTPLQIAGGLVVVVGVMITSRHDIASQRKERAEPSS
ncbi:MAG TPA: DMT family transporter [Actinophytocola sp.]|uniref:DMT family transporter n=1 Tax=Actinophytocola sp. TaxID=1872138 RepID=UPI002DF73EA0|nr:DMT family transporter [Actinophytocola sp.]